MVTTAMQFDRQFSDTPRVCSCDIRIIEYSNNMHSPLRAFKADVFQALAHPTRIAIVDALRLGEEGAGSLLAQLPVGQANLSQHLAILRAKRIVVSRKVGNQVYYSIRHPVLVDVLDLLKEYFNVHLKEIVGMLGESRPRVRKSRRA